MCKFGACILSKSELSKKCAYKKNNEEFEVPWKKSTTDYEPSMRLCPKNSGLPVLVDGSHFDTTDKRLFCPMYWTLIPPSFNKKPEDWSISTYNARVENLTESKLYSSALNGGNRCVIILEGFYEGSYYLNSPNNNLLKAAGLYSIKNLENGEKFYSCTIITTESDNNLNHIHNRMPLLLHDDEDVQAWLNFKNVSPSDAVSKIRQNPYMNLNFQKSKKTSDPDSAKKTLASKNFMAGWLKSGNSQDKKRKRED